MKSNMQNQYGILLVGESCVGKTAIQQRYQQNKFSYCTPINITVDMVRKQIQVQGNDLTINIFDFPAQNKSLGIYRLFYRQGKGVIFVYDVGWRLTFENINFWQKEINDFGNQSVTITLVGNKIDKQNERKVSLEEGQLKAKEMNALFFETSAKDDININEMFQKTIEKMLEQYNKKISAFEIDSNFKDIKKNKGQNCF